MNCFLHVHFFFVKLNTNNVISDMNQAPNNQHYFQKNRCNKNDTYRAPRLRGALTDPPGFCGLCTVKPSISCCRRDARHARLNATLAIRLGTI